MDITIFLWTFFILFTTSVPQATRSQENYDHVGCYWDGTAPFCRGQCPDGHFELRRHPRGPFFHNLCWFGSKALCCESSETHSHPTLDLGQTVPPEYIVENPLP